MVHSSRLLQLPNSSTGNVRFKPLSGGETGEAEGSSVGVCEKTVVTTKNSEDTVINTKKTGLMTFNAKNLLIVIKSLSENKRVLVLIKRINILGFLIERILIVGF